jgi:hypothetical protein
LRRLLPAWGLDYLDTWWWVKLGVVTGSSSLSQERRWYEPIHSIESAHRRPYERAIIASTRAIPMVTGVKRKQSTSEEDEGLPSWQETLLSDSASPLTQPVMDPRVKSQVIFSFPIRHSWKPPLQSRLRETLSTLFPIDGLREEEHEGETREGSLSEVSTVPEHEDLELFARELREGCLSIGNEVFFHQSVSQPLPSFLLLPCPCLNSLRWSPPHLLDSSRYEGQTMLPTQTRLGDEKAMDNKSF